MRQYQVTVNGKTLLVNLLAAKQGLIECEINGVNHSIEVSAARQMQMQAADTTSTVAAPQAQPRSRITGDGTVRAPMPGIVVQIMVKEGESVVAGAPVAVMEAMKMENTITAPAAGTVGAIAVTPGTQVENGAEIMRIIKTQVGD